MTAQTETTSSDCQASLQTKSAPTPCTRKATHRHRLTGRKYCLQHMRIEAHGLFRIDAVPLCSPLLVRWWRDEQRRC